MSKYTNKIFKEDADAIAKYLEDEAKYVETEVKKMSEYTKKARTLDHRIAIYHRVFNSVAIAFLAILVVVLIIF